MPRWNTTAVICKNEFGTDQCTCCDRKLTGAVRMLELDQRTQTYHDNGDVPSDKSQGWFPFGLGCARTKLKQHSTLTSATGGRDG